MEEPPNISQRFRQICLKYGINMDKYGHFGHDSSSWPEFSEPEGWHIPGWGILHIFLADKQIYGTWSRRVPPRKDRFFQGDDVGVTCHIKSLRGWILVTPKYQLFSKGYIVLPSGKLTVCYWKWPFIVDFPIKNGEFSIVMLVYQRVVLVPSEMSLGSV